jgi:hypothetical protein
MCGIYNRGKGLFSHFGFMIFRGYTNTFITTVCVYFFPIKQTSFFALNPFFSLALTTGILTEVADDLLPQKIKLPNCVSAGPLKASQKNPDKIILDF